jgi:hypothetical protein
VKNGIGINYIMSPIGVLGTLHYNIQISIFRPFGCPSSRYFGFNSLILFLFYPGLRFYLLFFSVQQYPLELLFDTLTPIFVINPIYHSEYWFRLFCKRILFLHPWSLLNEDQPITEFFSYIILFDNL